MNNWKVKKLKDLGNIYSGGTPDTTKLEYWNGNINWLTPSEISELKSKYIFFTKKRITELGLKSSSSKLLPVDSLIVCTRATIGSLCINKVEICTNQGFKNIIVNENNCVLFLYYLLLFYKVKLIEKANGSTFLEISKKDFENLSFLLPPLKEQERIAEVLSCWDDGIEQLQKIISLKEQQKQGLMQRLLTGKTRLPGFTQPWKEVKLGTILQQVNKRNKNLEVTQVLSITNSRGFILPKEQFSRVIASDDLRNYKIVSKGEFAYNPSRLNVGSIDRLDNFQIGILSPMYIIFRCLADILSNYLIYYIQTSDFNLKVKNSAQGSVRDTVDFTILSSMKVIIPSDLQEQSAIAAILSEADNEIGLLKRKLGLFKQQKQWLMQQLLTGKRRLAC